ncbi:TlyA family RNA methyltransferase [Metasolibacillus meyeri]|uniref:TlyA family RNA methyltransferase n=1 Tax=Metasolibacillus meyeri TaxID=1071052 RepID=A0AAW9NQC7_9BACL|nr:TlyA family RNA methyltransferase [Metasolibacillus meyeri]MEC1178220.1 TlyA family RNA methyltransferase [Metasolibacillus meyeri]
MTKQPKERVDILLVERGLCETREKAKRSIMAGLVYSNEERIDKAGEKITIDAPLQVKGSQLKYVSRGGLKLEKALEVFELSVEGKLMLDIGSSTGGFTDCALQNGARHCYALDVGSNQLAWKIRSDERVTVMEKTNFRYTKPEDLVEGLPDFATIDVSFISLSLILPVLKTVLLPGGNVMALVKPQFEAGKEKVGKKGIVREPQIHLEVLQNTANMATAAGFIVKDASYSPITGGEGNIEFLFHLVHPRDGETIEPFTNFEQIVEQAHSELKMK